jgi:hypothetical protein
MGFWDFFKSSSAPRTTVTVGSIGGTDFQSDGSVKIDLPGPVDIDTLGRTSVDIGNGMSIRSDGSVNFDFNSSSYGSFKSSFDP